VFDGIGGSGGLSAAAGGAGFRCTGQTQFTV
jgi:hypothetical protein